MKWWEAEGGVFVSSSKGELSYCFTLGFFLTVTPGFEAMGLQQGVVTVVGLELYASRVL